jgi:NADP-dependent 3-hydroxy acid dehydrogenase YdfG
MTIDVLAPFRLDGRVAIVTGASSGLGDRFARVLHAAGASVAVAARRVDRLEALADELGERAVSLQCDVAVEADCEQRSPPPSSASGGSTSS